MRNKTLFVRVSVEENELFKRAAWEKNMLLSQWVRAVLLQKLGREQSV